MRFTNSVSAPPTGIVVSKNRVLKGPRVVECAIGELNIVVWLDYEEEPTGMEADSDGLRTNGTYSKSACV